MANKPEMSVSERLYRERLGVMRKTIRERGQLNQALRHIGKLKANYVQAVSKPIFPTLGKVEQVTKTPKRPGHQMGGWLSSIGARPSQRLGIRRPSRKLATPGLGFQRIQYRPR